MQPITDSSPKEAQHRHEGVPLDPVRGVGSATAAQRKDKSRNRDRHVFSVALLYVWQICLLCCCLHTRRMVSAATALFPGQPGTHALTVTATRREGATRTADPAQESNQPSVGENGTGENSQIACVEKDLRC